LFQEKIMTTPYTLNSFNQSQDLGQSNLIYCFFNFYFDFYFSSFSSFSNLLGISDKKSLIYFKDAQFLVLINRLFAFVISIMLLMVNAFQKDKENYDVSPKAYVMAPLYEFVFCSLSNVISSWCQYEALKFVNFPTQVSYLFDIKEKFFIYITILFYLTGTL
jgi:adenosine 3'-phospho 5'-phosphosulfate transporter 1